MRACCRRGAPTERQHAHHLDELRTASSERAGRPSAGRRTTTRRASSSQWRRRPATGRPIVRRRRGGHAARQLRRRCPAHSECSFVFAKEGRHAFVISSAMRRARRRLEVRRATSRTRRGTPPAIDVFFGRDEHLAAGEPRDVHRRPRRRRIAASADGRRSCCPTGRRGSPSPPWRRQPSTFSPSFARRHAVSLLSASGEYIWYIHRRFYKHRYPWLVCEGMLNPRPAQGSLSNGTSDDSAGLCPPITDHHSRMLSARMTTTADHEERGDAPRRDSR